MLKSCLIEVEAFPDNEPEKNFGKRAYVKVYLRELKEETAPQKLSEACEFMGFKLVRFSKIEDVLEENVPVEARDFLASQGFGFGTFQKFEY